jgi:hypothetical protein
VPPYHRINQEKSMPDDKQRPEAYIVESRMPGSTEWDRTNCPTANDVLRVVEDDLRSGAAYIKITGLIRAFGSDDMKR